MNETKKADHALEVLKEHCKADMPEAVIFLDAVCYIKHFENAQDNKISLELTADEAEVIEDYIFRKACRLKDSGLEDSKCYPKLMSVHRKLTTAMKKEI